MRARTMDKSHLDLIQVSHYPEVDGSPMFVIARRGSPS